jgi:hypothetical protein
MSILDFYSTYPDELSCKLHFKTLRDSQGVTCVKCSSTRHYWKKDKWQYECKVCKHRTTLRSGTVMQASKLSYQYWYIAMHLLSATKKSFSAKEMQRQLKHKRYEPIWAMMHKLRSIMGLRDDEYKLDGAIELDEGFFETVNRNLPKSLVLKRGRGSEKQTTVLVMIESTDNPNNDKTNRASKKAVYLKMKVIHNLKATTINEKIEANVEAGAHATTDDSTSYKQMTNTIAHTPQKVDKTNINKLLPWVHKAISNAKRLLLDVHHRIDDDFLQNYLNEFCYKFNRRYFGDKMMERLVIAAIKNKWNKL